MKLSKKIVAVILTMALIVAQLTVLPFAENTYASGLGDGASYALKVPADEKVGYTDEDNGWTYADAGLGINAENTGYGSSSTTRYIYTASVEGERFFALRPAANATSGSASVKFFNNAYNTYDQESTRIYNGIPSVVTSSGISGMAFRFKGEGSASDVMYLNLSLAAEGKGLANYNYVVKSGIKLLDVATGKVTDVAYDAQKGGIKLAGNVDGWLYAPFAGIIDVSGNAITAAALSDGYRGIKVAFATADYNGKTLYMGNVMFTQNLEKFQIIHGAPETPALKEAGKDYIEVNAVDGVLYSIDDGEDKAWSESGKFTGLAEGTNYTVYAKYDASNAKYVVNAVLSTAGVSAPVLLDKDHESITIAVKDGQEYSLDQKEWSTTGKFTGLTEQTEYTVYTRNIKELDEVKSIAVTTSVMPYASGMQDGAFNAVLLPDYNTLASSFVSADDTLGMDEAGNYVANGFINIKALDSEKFLALSPKDGKEGTVSINAAKITYGVNAGLASDMEAADSLKGLALRVRFEDDKNTAAAFDVALGNYTAVDGVYAFIDAETGIQSTVIRTGSFTVSGKLNGWLMIPFTMLKNGEAVLSAETLKTEYKTLDITLHGAGCTHSVIGDWTERTLYIGNSLFYTDAETFTEVRGVPNVPEIADNTTTSIIITPDEGVEYSIDNGATWTTNGKFTGLSEASEYVFLARYIGKTKTRQFNAYTAAGVSMFATRSNTTNKYSTGDNDGAYYMFRVPNTDASNNALPKNVSGRSYVTKEIGNFDTIPAALGKNADTNVYMENGVLFVETFHGDTLYELETNTADDVNIFIKSNGYYNGEQFYSSKGIPSEIDASKITGFAFRIKVTGGTAGQLSGIDIRFDYGDGDGDGKKDFLGFFRAGVKEYQFIDSVTGISSTIKVNNAFVIDRELDGWLIVPLTAHQSYNKNPSAALAAMIANYDGFGLYMHNPNCSTSHGSSWSDWSGRKLYVGDSLFLTDMELFMDAHAAPPVPTLVSKSSFSIIVNAEEGTKYSIVKSDAPDVVLEANNTTGIFNGLDENTQYTVIASHDRNDITAQYSWYTDMVSPPLTPPVLKNKTFTTLSVEVVHGLEYSIDGKTWTEDGEWAGLEIDTEYTVIARNKVTKERVSKVYCTEAYVNIYATGFGDTTTWILEMPNPAVTPTTSASLITTTKRFSPTGATNVPLNIVESYGDYLAQASLYPNPDTGAHDCGILTAKSSVKYGTDGLPQEITLWRQEGVAFRVKAEGITGSGSPGLLSVYTNSGKGYTIAQSSADDIEFYYIDKATGNMVRKDQSVRFEFTEDFDGWIIVPMKSILGGAVTEKWLRENFKGFELYLHDGINCTHKATESCWVDRKFYVGNMLFVDDLQTFLSIHASPGVPSVKEKDSSSVTLNEIDNALYAIDDNSGKYKWQTSPEFKNLKENTEYKFVTMYDSELATKVSNPLAVYTDQTNPSLDAPQLIEGSLTYNSFQIRVIPGLEYALYGEVLYNEHGLFEDLEPGVKYTVIGRNKQSLETTAPIAITTPYPEQIYDRGDGSHTWFTVPKESDEYTAYYAGKTIGWNSDHTAGMEVTKGGHCDVVTIDGERFVNFTSRSTNDNFTLAHYKEWNRTQGVPDNIWLKDMWAIAIRLKVDEYEPQETDPTFSTYYRDTSSNMNKAYEGGWTYYTIDNETKTWQKNVYNTRFSFNGFDGWLILPFSSLTKNSSMTYSWFQNEFCGIDIYLRGGSSYGNSTWQDIGFYVGDSVFIEDPDKFTSIYAPNTEESIAGVTRNTVTDPSIPGVMMNDCTGEKVGNGVVAVNKTKITLTSVTKPNETSKALLIDPGDGLSSATLLNDALNFRGEIPQEVSDKVVTSLGVAFYVEVPKTFTQRVGFGMEILEEKTEYFNFGTYEESYHYTISNGVAKKNYGPIELKPGFKGYVMLPFDNFEYDSSISAYVDGMLFSPDTIEQFSLTFDSLVFPALSESYFFFDDFMFYQSVEEFVTAILKIQGTEEYEIIENIQNFRIDDCSGFPRYMANDCTGIEIEKGIYDFDNVDLALIDKEDSIDSYIDITIGQGSSSVLFENHAFYDEMTDEELYEAYYSTGVSFWVSVPDDALMTVGLDLEILEANTEYFAYDSNSHYYTVVDGEVSQVYGYLEFEPGFEGVVIIPFENFAFIEENSTKVDGFLYDINWIDYFGFYFNTDYYASIGGTMISIDDIALYQGETFDYIDAIWGYQTGNGTVIPNKKPTSSVSIGTSTIIPNDTSVNTDNSANLSTDTSTDNIDMSPNTGEATPFVAVAALATLSVAAIAFSRKRSKED